MSYDAATSPGEDAPRQLSLTFPVSFVAPATLRVFVVRQPAPTDGFRVLEEYGEQTVARATSAVTVPVRVRTDSKFERFGVP